MVSVPMLRGVSTLEQQLRADLTTAIKERDELRMSALRMALAELTAEKVSGREARELSDEDAVRVLVRESRKRRESAEAFAAGGRPELAERERAAGDVLAGYLPAQLDDGELARLVAEAIEQTEASGPAAMGAVMRAVTPQVAGRAEGARVAAEVRRQLAG
jgi:uncharacterized protein YqeY